MIMDRNTLLAFLLIAVILILTPFYMDVVSPPKKSEQTTTIKEPTPITPSPDAIRPERSQQQTDPPLTATPNNKEKHFYIKTDLYSAVISTMNGGSISSFEMLNYKMADSLPVQLINEFNNNNLLIKTRSIDGETLSFGGAWSSSLPHKTTINADRTQQSISFSRLVYGKEITKVLTFYPHTYKIDVETNLTAVLPHLSQGVYSISWEGGMPVTEKSLKDDVFYFKGYVYQGEELYTPKLKKDTSLDKKFIGQTDWVAIRSKYFTAALIPGVPGSAATISGTHDGNIPRFNAALHREISNHSITSLYLGPLQYDRVKALDVGLEKIMNFGWSFIRVIAKGVLALLVAMHNVIPNYGVVLVLFSILVKIVVYPLTKKSYQSTRKMQDVQPLLNALKEKHKNNPQQLNKATMALYKEKGVNPMGGCLPLLIQMPLLFALFQVFRSTIELRGAPFILWIQDLSAPDTLLHVAGFPINILPILMTITMLLQQKMTPAQPGQQKNMMYMMNVFFLFIFYRFPSGLNLYYTLFNLLTILQQKYLTPHTPSALPVSKRKK